MTGFEPRTSGLEGTALPTEPQRLAHDQFCETIVFSTFRAASWTTTLFQPDQRLRQLRHHSSRPSRVLHHCRPHLQPPRPHLNPLHQRCRRRPLWCRPHPRQPRRHRRNTWSTKRVASSDGSTWPSSTSGSTRRRTTRAWPSTPAASWKRTSRSLSKSQSR